MRPLLTIFAYSGMDDMLDRHWGGYEKSGCDLLISSPVDAPCKRGGISFAHSERFGPELMKRIHYTFNHVLKMGYDTYWFIEADSIVLRKAPTKLKGGLHGFLWDNADPNFMGRQYAHWAWGMNRATLTKVALMGRQYPMLEQGWPDRHLGYLCELTGVPMHHRADVSYSRNLLDTPEYIQQARDAIDSGVTFVHGVKTEQDLRSIGL